MKKIALVFDGDGVIFDTWPAAYDVWRKLSEELGLPAEKNCQRETDVRKYWGYPGPKFVKFLFPEIDPDIAFRKWVKIQRELLAKRKLGLVPGAEETLLYLKERGIIVGLLTNRDGFYFLRDFKDFPLEKYFDFVQTWQRFSCFKRLILRLRGKKIPKIHPVHFESLFFKPDPRVFKRICGHLQRNGIEKSDIYYLGDTYVDYEAAVGAGINFLGVKTGPLNRDDLWPKGTEVLDSAADLPLWLKRKEEADDGSS